MSGPSCSHVEQGPTPPVSAPVSFAVPPLDAVEDLHGDPLTADLVVFFNGNQFMVLDDLFAVFRAQHPEIRAVFYETLPPGILVEQVRAGALQMGRLTISAAPDVVTAGPDQLAALQMEGWVGPATDYASNDLALLVRAGNPLQMQSLMDLGRDDVRIAMPNPATEGVGRLIVQALMAAGGEVLVQQVMEQKVRSGQTRLTQIHHRESICWLNSGAIDVAPLWSTEARYHVQRGEPVDQIEISTEHNQRGRYAAAIVERRTRHPAAAQAFTRFLESESAQAVYRSYGFTPAVLHADR